jgi:hypothetical protein
MKSAAAFVLAFIVFFGIVFFGIALAPMRAEASCVGTTTTQVAAGLGNVPSGALVVASPLESDVAPSPNRSDELAMRVAQLVAGRIPGAHAATKTGTLDQARANASRSSQLVYVRVQIQKGQLRLTVDAYPVVKNVWDRARLPPPPPSGHAYAAAPMDAEVRAFFPPLPLELGQIHKATHGEGEVLAAACGDLDGDGAAELVLVSRERVALGRLRAGKFDVARTVPWTTLGKRVPVPIREPLGGAAIEVGRALVGTSDRGGVATDDSFGAPHALMGLPIGAGNCAPVGTARLMFEGYGACDGPPPPVRSARESFDAASAFDLVMPNGEDVLAVATREGGKLRVRVGAADKASFDGAGAQVALFDANFDGAPEVAFSSDADPDAITIASMLSAAPKIVNRIAAPAGVRALAACPSIDGGSAALVAVVGSEVWLVR